MQRLWILTIILASSPLWAGKEHKKPANLSGLESDLEKLSQQVKEETAKQGTLGQQVVLLQGLLGDVFKKSLDLQTKCIGSLHDRKAPESVDASRPQNPEDIKKSYERAIDKVRKKFGAGAAATPQASAVVEDVTIPQEDDLLNMDLPPDFGMDATSFPARKMLKRPPAFLETIPEVVSEETEETETTGAPVASVPPDEDDLLTMSFPEDFGVYKRPPLALGDEDDLLSMPLPE